MAYSARQIHCLNAMGIVPWVSRTEPATPTPTPTSSTHWINTQPLCVFSHRGMQVSSLGATSASLLVVSLLGSSASGDAPLDTQASQLFDLMMRAIGIPKSDLRITGMWQPGESPASAEGGPLITDLCSPQTRAILLLNPSMPQLTDHEKPANDAVGKVSIENITLPVWQLFHPDVLLQAPEHKRGAWEILKRFKQSLDT